MQQTAGNKSPHRQISAQIQPPVLLHAGILPSGGIRSRRYF
ncbi:hypothetical protein BRYFOR_06892 [Marvinbryantia formatexigens DSM 14469]|uniref:Uncharacterized protein n=1 Tax=Marvinbryantia formatexigens DSM 14469 TaxID=478749 RepID=C6LE43_9FIRM|nr:hypothetical protein BRYFOR_06892 [Marvinbryantia formatexigens DSM 14469]